MQLDKKVYLINMRKLIISMLMLFTLISCKQSAPVKEIVYVPVTDSTYIDSLVYYREILRQTQDSLNAIKDTTAEDLFVARYKLGRIKYYNDIAKNGNNAKFLRGWINRVLE